jgi:hypothetical protein
MRRRKSVGAVRRAGGVRRLFDEGLWGSTSGLHWRWKWLRLGRRISARVTLGAPYKAHQATRGRVHARLQAGYGVQSSSLPLPAECRDWRCRLRRQLASKRSCNGRRARDLKCTASCLRRVAVWQQPARLHGRCRSGTRCLARRVASCELRASGHHQHRAESGRNPEVAHAAWCVERHGGGGRLRGLACRRSSRQLVAGVVSVSVVPVVARPRGPVQSGR